MDNINQRINGSWLDVDAYRHYAYESICDVLWRNYSGRYMLNQELRVIEFGSLEPTTPIIRMLHELGERQGFKVKAEVGRPFPEDDLTKPLGRQQIYDVVIADQVLEHVLDPEAAIYNLDNLIKQGGLLILATPFLYPVHNCPIDVNRFTTVGMRNLLYGATDSYDILECRSWGGFGVYRWWLDHIYDWVSIDQARNECPGFMQPEYDSDWAMIVWMVAKKA